MATIIRARKSICMPLALGLFAASLLAACASDDGASATGSVSAAARGQAFAEASCAQCHAVRSGDTISPNAEAPTFDQIAGRPDMTPMALAVLLRTPHKAMPNYIVADDDVGDLAAYLSTLDP